MLNLLCESRPFAAGEVIHIYSEDIRRSQSLTLTPTHADEDPTAFKACPELLEPSTAIDLEQLSADGKHIFTSIFRF